MYTARCTRKVLQALQLLPVAEERSPSTALGDWYVNFIHTRHHRLVHFVSDRSLLSVVVPVKTLKTALDRHVESLRELLHHMGVEPALIQAEMTEMQDRVVAATASRSVLASMRDLALNARWALAQSPRITCLELSRELSQTPCGPLELTFPAEAAVALLVKRHSGPQHPLRGA